MTKRCFIAINLPSPIRATISQLQKSLRDQEEKAKIKWTAIENLHVTLKFIGNVAETDLPQIIDLLAGFLKHQKKIIVELNGLCFLPTDFQPRIIGVSLTDNEVTSYIAREISELLESQNRNIIMDQQVFQPHIPIGRNKGDLFPLDYNYPPVTGSFEAGSIDLMESVLNHDAPDYKILKRFELK